MERCAIAEAKRRYLEAHEAARQARQTREANNRGGNRCAIAEAAKRRYLASIVGGVIDAAQVVGIRLNCGHIKNYWMEVGEDKQVGQHDWCHYNPGDGGTTIVEISLDPNEPVWINPALTG